MENVSQSRRAFLAKIILLGGSAGLLWRFLTPRSPVSRQALLRVVRGDVPEQGALVYREARIAVLRNGNDVYALSLACTHLGCTVSVTERGLACPCHGSEFDRQGRVLKGPAVRDLQRLKVEERDGMLEVLG
jgi:Rieske Fe-S protein